MRRYGKEGLAAGEGGSQGKKKYTGTPEEPQTQTTLRPLFSSGTSQTEKSRRRPAVKSVLGNVLTRGQP